MKNAVKRNGRAKPIAYTPSSPTPFATVDSAAANARITAKIGPTHGVQPKPNADPTRNDRTPATPGGMP